MVYDAAHSALIVGGAAEQMNDSSDTEAAARGLTVWRVLSDAPYYKLVSDTETVAVSSVILLVNKLVKLITCHIWQHASVGAGIQ